jgi:hypothetical protein
MLIHRHHQACATHDFGPERGGVQVCRVATCGAVKETAILAATERAQTRPGKAEFTVEGACLECHYLGWLPFNGDVEIQRCDTCKAFKDDDEAHAYAIELAIAALKKRQPALFVDPNAKGPRPAPQRRPDGSVDWSRYTPASQVPKDLVGQVPPAEWARMRGATGGGAANI